MYNLKNKFPTYLYVNNYYYNFRKNTKILHIDWFSLSFTLKDVDNEVASKEKNS